MVGLAAIEHVAQIGCRNSPSLPACATSSGSAAVDAMFGAGRALNVMVMSATLDPTPDGVTGSGSCSKPQFGPVLFVVPWRLPTGLPSSPAHLDRAHIVRRRS